MSSLTALEPLPTAPRAVRQRLWLAGARQSAMAIGLACFLLAILWLVIGFELVKEQDAAESHARRSLVNLTRAFAEHSAKTIEGADQAVRYARNEYLEKGGALDLSHYLGGSGIVGPEYNLMTIIGADGYVTHSTQPFQRVDLRDREHFRVHAQAAVDRLFISRPVLGRVSNKWSIQLTRRIDLPDGRFGGVVVLSLSPDYLTRFYGEVDLGRQGVIALIGQDGTVRASAGPDGPLAPGDLDGSSLFRHAMAQREGSIRTAGPADGVDRMWAFRRLDDYGLIVICGIGMQDVLSASLELRRNMLAAGSLVTLVVLGFIVLLVRHACRQITLVAELESSRSAAQAGNRLKTRFLASVSHELRTPLNGILGFAETIRDTSSDADSREYGGVIHASASQLHAMVDTILDLVKIETGRMTIQPVPVAVEELLRGLHARHAATAQARGLRLWMVLQPGCPAMVETDPARLRRVLDQLLANALKFTEQGEVSVIARSDAGRLRIEIGDTGIGIAPDKLATLFNRFESAMGSFDHAGQGAGLGLPLAHELTLLLGGTLQIRSVPGQGTTATITLPPQAPPVQQPTVSEDALHV